MILTSNYLRKKETYIVLFGLLIFLPSLLLRDYTPGNELKYISIAKTMLKNGDILVLKNLGELYPDKPPLYFWIINLTKIITGRYSLSLIGLFSAVPSILITVIMYRWGKRFIGESYSFLASLMLLTTALYFGVSVVLRMDMLMTLFILMSLYKFFSYYEDPVNNRKDLNWVYIGIIFAVFTKGPAGLLIPIVSIVTFLVIEKNMEFLKRLSLIKGFSFILLFFLIWFTFLLIEGGREYLYLLTVKQTVGRGINAFTHQRPFYYYLKNILANTFPWGVMYIGAIGYGILNLKKINRFEKFMLSSISASILVFSCFSSKLDIYLIPIYPFFPYFSMSVSKNINMNRKKFYWITLGLVELVLCLSVIALFFLPEKIEGVPVDVLVKIMLIIVSILSGIGLNFLRKKKYEYSIISLAAVFTVIILAFSSKLPDVNPNLGLKRVAMEIEDYENVTPIKEIVSFNYTAGQYIGVYLDRPVKLFKNSKEFRSYMETKKNVAVVTRAKDRDKFENNPSIYRRSKEIYKNNSFVLLFVGD